MRKTMSLHSQRISLAALVLLMSASALMACGGKDAPTIKYRLDMSTISQTPAEERETVADAYSLAYQAQLERAHTEWELKDTKYALQIAKARQDQRKHEERIAKLEGKRSEMAFMASLADNALKLLNGMKKQTIAQKGEIRYLKAQRKFLRKQLAYNDAQILATEAAFELAKAKLCKQRGTMPKGFNLDKFVSQDRSFKARASKRQQSAKASQANAIALEKAWKNASK